MYLKTGEYTTTIKEIYSTYCDVCAVNMSEIYPGFHFEVEMYHPDADTNVFDDEYLKVRDFCSLKCLATYAKGKVL